jgi:guanine nucleotide-binding protein subunit alpha-12
MFQCACCLKCLFNYSAEEIERREQSRRIDKILKQDEPKFRRLVKLLLLGAGESGKSTFLKQMKIIHGFKFDPVAVEEFRSIIYQNVVQGMKVLVDARQKLGIPWEFPENQVHADVVMQFSNRHLPLDEDTFLTFAGPVQILWKDASVKTAFDRRREFQLVDSVQYFFDNLDRIARPVSDLK